MGASGQELRPFEPVEDELVLAAIDRALLHRQASEVWLSVVAEHLGFEPGAPTTRRLRPQLVELHRDGLVTVEIRYSREYVSLTSAGQVRFDRSRRARMVGELPESPQHRAWRLARIEARRRRDEFRSPDSRPDVDEDPGPEPGRRAIAVWPQKVGEAIEEETMTKKPAGKKPARKRGSGKSSEGVDRRGPEETGGQESRRALRGAGSTLC
jgi:hypothetical protein